MCSGIFVLFGIFLISFLFGFFFKYRFMFNSGTKSLAWTVTLFTGCPKCYIYTVFNFLTGILSKTRLFKQWHLMILELILISAISVM